MRNVTPRYHAGGALWDDALYVVRPADQQILESLQRGEFCYVLAPRQMGKSSLRVRTERLLSQRGVRCAGVDLAAYSSQRVEPDEWYFGLAEGIADGLGLPDPAHYWSAQTRLPPPLRWARYLRDEVLAKAGAPVVLFVDEIQLLCSLPFAGEFFEILTAIYNDRAGRPLYKQLSVCLLGAVPPSELGRKASCLVMGRSVDLEDFTAAEIRGFLDGSVTLPCRPEPLLEAVLSWTDGHPYMTQCIFAEIAERTGGGRPDWSSSEEEIVGQVVHDLFLRPGCNGRFDFSYAARTLVEDNPRAASLLHLYRRVLEGQWCCNGCPTDEETLEGELRFSGFLSKKRDSTGNTVSRVRNRIIAAVFNSQWASVSQRNLYVRPASPASLSPAGAPTGQSLRDLLRRVLRTDSDLRAFFIDELPDNIRQRLDGFTDRLATENLLLQLMSRTEILRKLYEYRTADFLAHESVLRFEL